MNWKSIFGGGDNGGEASNLFIVGDERMNFPPKNDEQVLLMCSNIAKSLTKRLPTEQDIYWFVVEQYDRLHGAGGRAIEILASFPLHEIEHRGSRSETSYVGKPNPGVVFLDKQVMPQLTEKYGAEAANNMRASIFIMFCDGFKQEVNRLRKKYAVHYANNATKAGHFNKVAEWDDLIAELDAK